MRLFDARPETCKILSKKLELIEKMKDGQGPYPILFPHPETMSQSEINRMEQSIKHGRVKEPIKPSAIKIRRVKVMK